MNTLILSLTLLSASWQSGEPASTSAVRIETTRNGGKWIMRLKETLPEGVTVTSREWLTFPKDVTGFDIWEQGQVGDFAPDGPGTFTFVIGVGTSNGKVLMSSHVIDTELQPPVPRPAPPIPQRKVEPPPRPAPTDPEPAPNEASYPDDHKNEYLSAQPPRPQNRQQSQPPQNHAPSSGDPNVEQVVRDWSREQVIKTSRGDARQISTLLQQTANLIDTGNIRGQDAFGRAYRVCQDTMPRIAQTWREWWVKMLNLVAPEQASLTRAQTVNLLRNVAEILLEE